MTLCSPDPQAFRPPEDKVNVLQVRLPTNFKSARFDSDAAHRDPAPARRRTSRPRASTGGGKIELPVKLKVHDSVFVPLAKWCDAAGRQLSLRAGGRHALDPGRGAQGHRRARARCTTGWSICASRSGADADDMVPFEKYANAAESLVSPSSAARALANGAPNIERVDQLVQAVAAGKGKRSEAIDNIVALVDGWVERNRKKAA